MLDQSYRGFKQVGKEKREQQNEKSTTRHVENGRCGHEERHRGDYIPCAIVEREHVSISAMRIIQHVATQAQLGVWEV
jgi:hypothetical protein